MKRGSSQLAAMALASIAMAGACGGGDSDPVLPDDPDAGPTYLSCSGTDQAFVRNAYLAVLGQRPASQAEVNVYADIMAEVRSHAEQAAEAADGGAGPDVPDPREVVVRLMLDRHDITSRWAEHIMDALEVPRIEDQSQRTCYGLAARSADQGIADGQLAAHVRDSEPLSGGDGLGDFTMLDLLRSSIALDDVSVVYRAHLFALVSRPIPAANVPPVEAELARREDFGLVFDAAYLHRDMVCLGCHNSESSITFHPEPEQNRHWAMPGYFEKAIYGNSLGIATERAHAPFRYDGFVVDPSEGDSGTVRPWDWSRSCGRFVAGDIAPDPAEVDGKLASLTGNTLTVFDLEAALDRGFDAIAEDGLNIGPDGNIADPDQALAYLVAASIVESVWREVVGTPLTIANYFPRNEPARDVLVELTNSFVASGFSLRELLVDITLSPYFNRPSPDSGCGDGPYDMPPIYDPWVISDPDPARHNNGAGDAVVALSPRVLLRAAYSALEWPWPYYYTFPELSFSVSACGNMFSCDQMQELCESEGTCCEGYQVNCADPPDPGERSPAATRAFERGIGVFLKHGERGFRGLDFQARLVWEDVFGACRNPRQDADFVADLVARAQSQGATVGDVVTALKDRLIGHGRVSHEPTAAGVSERDAVSAIMGELGLAADQVADLEDRTRAMCGVLMSSPQFLLTGMTAPDSRYIPELTRAELGYDSVCGELEQLPVTGGLTLSCGSDSVSISR